MAKKTYQDMKPYPEQVKLVILDMDGFLYPYDRAYMRAAASAALAIRKEYHIPVFREKEANKLIEEAKKGLEKDPDDPLYRYIAKLSDRMEEKGLPGVSVLGLLEARYNSWKARRRGGEDANERDIDPPYKEMIAQAFNLQMMRGQREGSKTKLTRDEVKAKIIEGDIGITRLWHDHMGTGFLHRDEELVEKISRLKDSGVEVAILTHSCRDGVGGALAKVEKLGLKGVIPDQNIFGLEELVPHKKGKHPHAFELVLEAINSRRDASDAILPSEVVMGEDTVGNLRGAKKTGMETVWVRGKDKEMPANPSRKMQKKLEAVDHAYGSAYQFLDALNANIEASREEGAAAKKLRHGRSTPERGGSREP